MKYHNITKDDMLNGDGLRVVLWVSGCEHHCDGCQNPITWNPNDGVVFDDAAKAEIFEQLEKSYISGLTLSGGDPLHPDNRKECLALAKEIKERFPNKTVWCYTGYDYEVAKEFGLECIDVLCDGKFVKERKSLGKPWVGSDNQRVIDVPKSLETNTIVLFDNEP